MMRKAVIVLRMGIVVVLALAALTTGLAFAANWVFPLAVLQQVGLASEGFVRGVVWEADLMSDEAPYDGVFIGMYERSAHFTWNHSHRTAPSPAWDSREFWGGPWPAGIQTYGLRRPYRVRLADGSNVEYRSTSSVYLELPLWGLCPVLGAYPCVVLCRGPLRRWRRRRKGLCIRCGYNLEGNESGVCSECGEAR